MRKGFMSIQFSMLAASVAFVVTCFSAQPAGETSKPPCCATNHVPSGPLTDKSLYQLDSSWTTDSSQTIKLASLQGRVQVLAMFFTSCQYACPIIVHDMKRLE